MMAAPTTRISLRQAIAADFAAVLRLRNQLVKESRVRRPDSFRPLVLGATEALFRSELSDPDGLTLIAECNGTAAGYAYVFTADHPGGDMNFPRRVTTIWELVVDPSHQRRGVGRALLRAIEAHATRDGAEVITLNVDATNNGARAFYEREGLIAKQEHRQKLLRHVRRIESE